MSAPWVAFPGKVPVCRVCGADWQPVRRGECLSCGSDAGPLAEQSDGLAEVLASHEWVESLEDGLPGCRCGWINSRQPGEPRPTHRDHLAAAVRAHYAEQAAALARVEALRSKWSRLAGSALDLDTREWLTACSLDLHDALRGPR